MARAIDLLAEHWLATRGKRKHHTVKLGEKELTVWWGPWNLNQQDYVYHDMVKGQTFRPEHFARVVLVKAENEAGARLFAEIEKIELMTKVDPQVIKAIAMIIIADRDADNAAAGEADGPKAAAPAGTTAG